MEYVLGGEVGLIHLCIYHVKGKKNLDIPATDAFNGMNWANRRVLMPTGSLDCADRREEFG